MLLHFKRNQILTRLEIFSFFCVSMTLLHFVYLIAYCISQILTKILCQSSRCQALQLQRQLQLFNSHNSCYIILLYMCMCAIINRLCWRARVTQYAIHCTVDMFWRHAIRADIIPNDLSANWPPMADTPPILCNAKRSGWAAKATLELHSRLWL